MNLFSFACSLDGVHETVINHVSRGKAKARFLIELDMDGIEFTDIKCRKIGLPATTQRFINNAEYRNIQFAHCGMMVEVGGEKGWIVGHNSSANLDVLFDKDSKYGEQVLNCHPNYKIKYFDEKDNLIKSFE